MGGLVYLNSQPYVSGFTNILTGNLGDNPFTRAVAVLPQTASGIPYIGGITEVALVSIGSVVATLGAAGGLVLGITGWALVQTAQLLPIAVFRDQPRLGKVISSVETQTGGRVYDTESEENGTLKKLKEFHNSLPSLWIDRIYLWANLAFLIDMLVCSLYYPVLKVNVQEFMFTRGIDQVNWVNAVITFGCVFGFWALFDALLSYLEGQRHIGGSR